MYVRLLFVIIRNPCSVYNIIITHACIILLSLSIIVIIVIIIIISYYVLQDAGTYI